MWVSPLVILVVGFVCPAGAFSEPTVESEVRLEADAKAGTSASRQVQAAFGVDAVESPDAFPENHPGVAHILIEEEAGFGAYFKFLLHRDLDGDRHKSRAESDRQRNEIKGYAGSEEGLKATHGQVARYRWKFRIDSDLKVSYQFCHLFQLKGVGGKDVNDPVLTLSAVLSKGEPVLELRYWKGRGAREKRIELARLDSVKGAWLQCDLLVKCGEHGAYRFSVSSLDGKTIAEVSEDDVNTWREGMDFARPKWGIYRSIRDGVEGLNEVDVVSFADFRVQELSGWPKSD
ncbi:MAG: hypothetical protein AAF591_07790 [Verrucomicrobiota bacterium]